MHHTVVGIERGTWTVWQAQLLAWSFKRAGEQGPLTFIEAGGKDEFEHGDVFETVNYRSAGHDDYPREQGDYPPFNRIYGLRDWLAADGPQSDVLVIVDCDFAWFEPFPCPEVVEGAPWAQDWSNNQFMRWNSTDYPGTQAFGVPLCIHRKDLERMLPRWIERTHAFRDMTSLYQKWLCEMYGMAAAARLEGITFNLGTFDDQTFVHYFPYRDGMKWRERDNWCGFNKFHYTPWTPVPVEGPPLHRRFTELVNEYVECHRDP